MGCNIWDCTRNLFSFLLQIIYFLCQMFISLAVKIGVIKNRNSRPKSA